MLANVANSGRGAARVGVGGWRFFGVSVALHPNVNKLITDEPEMKTCATNVQQRRRSRRKNRLKLKKCTNEVGMKRVIYFIF